MDCIDGNEPQVEIAILNLFKNQLFTDVTVKYNPGNKQYRVHKLILALYSPVLCDDFYGKSECDDIIYIEGSEPSAVENMISFCYGELPVFKNISEIKATKVIAERYKIVELLNICMKEIDTVTVDTSNVLILLEMSVQSGNKNKENECLEIISHNRETVFASELFLKMKFEIVNQIFEKLREMGFLTEVQYLRSAIEWMRSDYSENKEKLMEKIEITKLSQDEFVDIIISFPDFFTNTEIAKTFRKIKETINDTSPNQQSDESGTTVKVIVGADDPSSAQIREKSNQRCSLTLTISDGSGDNKQEMPHTCAAVGCTNNNMKAICKEKKISFYLFPLKKPECKEWLIKLKRENFVPTEYSHLCSEHFTEDCFIYQPFTNRRGLKPGAIPTLFSYVKTSKRKQTSYEFGKSVPQPLTSNASSDLTNDKEIQTDDNSFSILYENNKKLEEENVLLKEQLQKRNLTPDNVESDYIMNILTGFDKQRFGVICDFLCLKNTDDITNGRQKLFMFLVRLKVGLTEDEMAAIFALSQSTISRYLKEITEAIYSKIKNVNIWPSKENIKLTMPYDFQKNFPECRVILDCTEFKIQKPSDPTEQQLTFSFYKNTNTVKCLIGVTPSGAISFISDTFTGSISDEELFLKSGILTILQKGDLIIADRGFLVKKELEKAGINIKTPHFLKDKIQFDFEERKENKKISHHRRHVERAIGRIKRFKLLNGPIPYTLLPSINEIVYIAGFLVNFGTRLI